MDIKTKVEKIHVYNAMCDMIESKLNAENKKSEYEHLLIDFLLKQIQLDKVYTCHDAEALIKNNETILRDGLRTTFSDIATMIASCTDLRIRFVRDHSRNYMFYENDKDKQLELFNTKEKELKEKVEAMKIK